MSSSFEPPQPAGSIEVARPAILAVISAAVMSCYGVVDLAPRSLTASLGKRLGRSSDHRGIEVTVNNGHLLIELSVVVEYGVPIFTVASNVMKTVQFEAERVLGMTVDRVNVTVDGLRVSRLSGGSS
jgi:uncharacterized alkaline shock family protein YloU